MGWTGKSCVGIGVLAAVIAAGIVFRLTSGLTAEPPRQSPAPADTNPPPPPKKPTAEELRKRFPFESLADRLDYEPAAVEALAKSESPPKTTAETMKRLKASEDTLKMYQSHSLRTQSLKMLHSDQVEEFINREGFGVSRVARVAEPEPIFLELPTAPTIPFNPVIEAKSLPGDGGDEPTNAASKLEQQLLGFHDQSRLNFLDPSSLGYIKDRNNVAGFQSHQFRRMPPEPAASDKEKWAVIRLELVSLLKHDHPVVYSSDHLPRMDDLKGAPTRPLIPFEEKGLKALMEGDDLATDSSGDRIHLMGSLRAATQCLDCHQVKRGDLLGAFSYELQRQPAPTAIP